MSNMVVRTNVMSLNSHRNLGMTGTMQARSAARLSSGFRINSAADDAAGLAISEKMRSQIRGLDQASRNGQDGISLIQTAEGAMQTVNEMVTRIRELVIQAANDTNAHDGENLVQSDRMQIQREINQLLEEIDQVTLRTEFNTRTLLDGSLGTSVSLSALNDFATADLGGITFDADGNFIPTTNVTDIAALNETFRIINSVGGGDVRRLIGILDAAGIAFDPDVTIMIGDVATEVGVVAATPNTHAWDPGNNPLHVGRTGYVTVSDLTWAMDTLNRLHDVFEDSYEYGVFSELDNADALTLTENFETFNGFLNLVEDIMYHSHENAGRGIWFQIGANVGQGIRLEIDSVNVNRLHEVATEHTGTVTGFNVGDLRNVDLIDGAGVMRTDGGDIDQFVAALDAALAHVTGERAHLGAVQNRLEFTIENLDTASENLSASNSRIRDADMAKEMMRFTQANVLQQAAISMLAQANMAPQNILQLLG